MNTAYIAGIVCGVLVALICYVIFHVAQKAGKAHAEYDERQQAIRDKGFRFAYLTLIVYMLVFAILNIFELITGDLSAWLFIGVIISLLVHIIYSIYNDAYFKVSDSPKSFTILFSVVGVSNIVLGVMKRVNGEVTEPFPSYGDLNGIVGVMLLVAVVNILIKLHLDKKAETE